MSNLMKKRTLAKALARVRDEERLARGDISPQELQKENSISRGFRKMVGFGPKLRPKSVDFIDVHTPAPRS
jgi:hypothetical protein